MCKVINVLAVLQCTQVVVDNPKDKSETNSPATLSYMATQSMATRLAVPSPDLFSFVVRCRRPTCTDKHNLSYEGMDYYFHSIAVIHNLTVIVHHRATSALSNYTKTLIMS